MCPNLRRAVTLHIRATQKTSACGYSKFFLPKLQWHALKNNQGQKTYSIWLDGERGRCAGRSFVGTVVSKVLKELVRLSFVNGEDENSRDEGFVLWKVRERRRKFGNFF